jgi:nicotinic acetylcholine receptor
MFQVSYVDEFYYGEMYRQIRYIFYFRRKPLYYITTLIIPCMLMSFLSLLVFLLPAEAEEKISLGITILLSFSVFQLLIAGGMPQTSDYVPIISK